MYDGVNQVLFPTSLKIFTRTTLLLANNFAPNCVHLEMLEVTSSSALVGAGFTSSRSGAGRSVPPPTYCGPPRPQATCPNLSAT